MVRALFMKDVRLVKKNLLIMLVMIIGMPVFQATFLWSFLSLRRMDE